MKTVAFIPLRGGSKSIPLKNIKLMGGKPLAYWCIKAALNCNFIDEVVISTDSELIKNTLNFINHSKLYFYNRSSVNANDTASTESAMYEYFKDNSCDNIILIQATSPLLNAEDLNKGLEIYFKDKLDSLISLVRIKRFFWNQYNGIVVPVNYDFTARPRRQEFSGQLVENGAFYITKYEMFMNSKCRLNGKIGHYEMTEDSFLEIDEPSDWTIIENLLIKNRVQLDFSKLLKMKVFASDIDGCLTDAGMYYTENGDEIKKFNTRDGMGFNLLQKQGVKVGVITSEDRELNRRRAQKLNLDFEYHGAKSKLQSLIELCTKYNVAPSEVVYVGDDINDLEIMEKAGFSICPHNATTEIKNIANYISDLNGGEGVIRQIVDLYLNMLHKNK